MKARYPHAQCAVVLLEQHDPRLTAEAQNLERGERWMEARCRRDGSETEASWRRAGGETQTEARQQTQTRWRRDGRWRRETGARCRWRRDGGEMEARRGRDGGGDEGGGDEWRERRSWLLTLTLTRVRSCGFSRRSQSEHPALKVSRRTCGSVRRHDWRVIRRPASSPTRLSALADGALRSPHEPSGAAALLSAAASTMLEARAEHRPGVRQLENVARAASQLSLELAPPARRPRAPARKQRGVAELCCAHLSDVQLRWWWVGGGGR